MLDSGQLGVAPGGPPVHRKRAAAQVAEGRGMKLRSCLIGVVHCFLIVQTGTRSERQTAERHLVDVQIVVLLAPNLYASSRNLFTCQRNGPMRIGLDLACGVPSS